MPISNSMPTMLHVSPFVALVLLAGAVSAQSQLEWLRTHDGPTSGDDRANQCVVLSNGNACLAGRSYDGAGAQVDVELACFSPSGAELWSTRVDPLGHYEWVVEVLASPADDIYVHGFGYMPLASYTDTYLLKFSSSGALLWQRSYAGPYDDNGYGLALDAAGNVLVCGSASDGTDHDALVESYSPAGTLNWSVQLDGGAQDNDAATALTVLPSGEIVVAGQVTDAMGAVDATVWKLASNGAVIWSRLITSAANTSQVVIAPNGKLVVGGLVFPTVNTTDWLVAQLDAASGTVDWIATYDGTDHQTDLLSSIAVDADGTVWASGILDQIGAQNDIGVRRYSSIGAVLSTAVWNNGATNLNDSISTLRLGSAGQAWVCGHTTLSMTPFHSDAVLAQLDAAGAINWVATYSTPGAHDDRASQMALVSGNRIAIGGLTNGGSSGTYDFLALRVDLNDSPQAYCTAKTTSNGCEPRVSFTGTPSASASSGFVVDAQQLRNQKNGVLFYGVNGAAANPFQGGTMCVAAPTVRTGLQSSGGNSQPVDDCSGSFAIDMNSYAAGALRGAPLPALQVPGTAVNCQFWGRDPGFHAPHNTMLSNALRYVVLP